MWLVKAFRKSAVLDKNLKFTHVWRLCSKSAWDKKSDALRWVRIWSTKPYFKVTLQKKGE